jgi:Holliday junction resolvase RusA-like endonuclease
MPTKDELLKNMSPETKDLNADVLGIARTSPQALPLKSERVKGVTYGKLPIAVKIPYLGAVLSVNHYKIKGRFTRPEVKRWMNDLAWSIQEYRVDWSKVKLPLDVTCSGTFKDNRYPDLSNLAKVTLDSIQSATGINDKYFRWHDGTVTVGGYPELIIKIEER